MLTDWGYLPPPPDPQPIPSVENSMQIFSFLTIPSPVDFDDGMFKTYMLYLTICTLFSLFACYGSEIYQFKPEFKSVILAPKRSKWLNSDPLASCQIFRVFFRGLEIFHPIIGAIHKYN